MTCWYCCREHDPFLSSSWRYENQNGDWDGEPEFGGEVVSTGEWQDSVSGFLSRKTTPKEEVNYYDDDGDSHWGGKKCSQDDASYSSLNTTIKCIEWTAVSVIRIVISRGDSFTRCLQLTRFRRWHKKKEVLTRISRSVESENCSTPHSPPPPLNTFYIFFYWAGNKTTWSSTLLFFVFQLLSRRKRSAEKVTLYIREHRLTWLHLFRVFSESKRNKCSKHKGPIKFPRVAPNA